MNGCRRPQHSASTAEVALCPLLDALTSKLAGAANQVTVKWCMEAVVSHQPWDRFQKSIHRAASDHEAASVGRRPTGGRRPAGEISEQRWRVHGLLALARVSCARCQTSPALNASQSPGGSTESRLAQSAAILVSPRGSACRSAYLSLKSVPLTQQLSKGRQLLGCSVGAEEVLPCWPVRRNMGAGQQKLFPLCSC